MTTEKPIEHLIEAAGVQRTDPDPVGALKELKRRLANGCDYLDEIVTEENKGRQQASYDALVEELAPDRLAALIALTAGVITTGK